MPHVYLSIKTFGSKFPIHYQYSMIYIILNGKVHTHTAYGLICYLCLFPTNIQVESNTDYVY